MKPLLVRRVVDAATQQVLERAEPVPVRRAASRETAATLARWLTGVVTDPDGTGKRARLDLWRVAGKTGTAQKADPITHRYSVDKRFSSFVGFAPAEAPRIVIGVFIDEPRGEVYGGELAAPVFKQVAELALKGLGVPPDLEPVALSAPRRAEAKGDPSPALDDEPPPLREDEPPPLPTIDEEGGPTEEGGVAVPALTGLPARLAIKALEDLELIGEVSGSGRVASQAPKPGQVVERGARVRLVLTPPG